MATTILIVDDEPRNTIALSAVLRAKGFSCLTAPDAESGVRTLKEHEGIAIVLLDMMMPDIDGYEAIPLLHQERDVPVIAVTAQAMVGDREKCLAAGAAGYISKPVDVDKLLLLLKFHLKQ